MAEPTTLAQRIKAEFDALAERKKSAEQHRAKEAESREKGLAEFGRICDELKSVWRPRIEEFAKQFGEKLKLTPSATPSLREAKAVFLTDMATMNLTLSAAPSLDATKLVLDYDLLIVPIFFDYERHARLEVPLDKVDKAAIGKWMDDQLVSCAKAYLSMQENQIYIQRAMVEDPVTKVKLLREEAKGKLEHGGQTYYFSSEDSLREYKKKLQIEPAPAAIAPAAPTAPASGPAKDRK
ncbi:MAG: hypothetical protein IT436_16875 [Phycisphaerales bacterium]|nr:hypothetical protein [Phycisphaerales bacterium]